MVSHYDTNIMGNAIWKPDDRLCFIYSIKNTFDKKNRERIEGYWLKYNEKAIKFIKNNKLGDRIKPENILHSNQINFIRIQSNNYNNKYEGINIVKYFGRGKNENEIIDKYKCKCKCQNYYSY